MAVRKAVFKGGIDSITINQRKKHYTQFKKNEKIYLTSLVSTLKNIRLSKHAKNKKKEITINLDEIKQIVANNDFEIIEYNRMEANHMIKDERVLLRSISKYSTNDGKEMCNICFVLSLKTSEVVTVYYNKAYDNHGTIKFDRYDKNLKII